MKYKEIERTINTIQGLCDNFAKKQDNLKERLSNLENPEEKKECENDIKKVNGDLTVLDSKLGILKFLSDQIKKTSEIKEKITPDFIKAKTAEHGKQKIAGVVKQAYKDHEDNKKIFREKGKEAIQLSKDIQKKQSNVDQKISGFEKKQDKILGQTQIPTLPNLPEQERPIIGRRNR
jgi:chromosome segregation ATPase